MAYSLDELYGKLERADAAGDTEAATVIADEIRRVQAAPKADFSGVTATGSSTATREMPAPRTLTQEAGRSLGLGTRGAVQGVYDLAGVVFDPIAKGYEALTGQPQATSSERGTQLADWLGLPAPETGVERVSTGITSALTGGGGLIGIGRGVASRAPGVARAVGEGLAAAPGTQLAAATGGATASGVARESGAGEVTQILAGVGGSLAPGAAKAGAAEALRRAFRGGEAGRQQAARTIGDFRAVGATPSTGQATGNRVVQGVENLLAGGPTSAPVMGRFVERQADDIGAGLGRMADDIAPGRATASAERAGRAITGGVEDFARDVKATRTRLYNEADARIPATTAVPMTNTQQALTALTTPTVGAESTTAALINPRIATLARTLGEDLMAAQASGAGGIPYQAARALRSRIGEELQDFALSPDRPTAQYKALYAALSRDLEDAARTQGPGAVQAMNRANHYFRASADRLEQLERVVDKAGGPEKVYNATLAGTRDGATTLRAVLQSLPAEGQQSLAAAVIKRMGLATPGEQGAAGEAFSAATFLTNWNKVSPEAKRALFGRLGPRYADNIDRLARVAENIKTGAKVYANPSGTANRTGAAAYLLSLAGAAGTANLPALGFLAGGGLSANLLARGLTNPKFVGWLANSTSLPTQAAPQAILQLKRDAERDGDVELAELAGALQEKQDQAGRAGNN